MKKIAALIATLSIAAFSAAASSFQVEVRGSGRPILFIPGLACDGSVWDEAVSRYSSNHQCHVFSLAGFAATPPSETNKAILETVTNELASYMEENELRHAVIVGHSLGGFVALSFAIEHPQAASQLLIVDSLPYLPAIANPTATVESTKAQAAAQRKMMSQGSQNDAQLRQMLRMMVTSPDNIERALAMSASSHAPTVAQAMYELNTVDLRESVSKISTPTTVLGAWYGYSQFGATQESVAATFHQQYQKHPNYRLVLSEKGKHFIMWDDPELFYQELDTLLDQ